MPVMPFTGKFRDIRAFSLIEVVLSLGIVSFACITLIGLIPVGLISFHQALNNTAETQIVQNLASGMELASYANVTNLSSGPYANTNFYYDSEGIALPNSTGSVYTASVASCKDLSYSTNAFPLSSSSSGGSALSSGVGTTMLIQISSPNSTNYFPVIIANSHQ